MFASACSKYAPLICQIGGGSPTVEGFLFGSGCLLSPTLIITARHIVRDLPNNLTWPVVLKHDGLFQCEVSFESVEQDIAILRVTKLVETVSSAPPREYPLWPTTLPSLGMCVGYMGKLHLPGSKPKIYFAPSMISMLHSNSTSQGYKCMLNEGVVESGFSGCAVFAPDGQIHGVIVEFFQFSVKVGNQQLWHRQPVMSCLGPILAPIRQLVG